MPTKLSMAKIIKIRKEIRNGKSRRQISRELNIPLDTAYKYGKHITPGRINDDFKNLIRREVISGKTKKQVAKEYGLSYCTVRRITKDINKRRTSLTDEEMQLIREMASKGKTKKQVSIDTGVPYRWVLKHTKNITSGRFISDSIRKKIKALIRSGKSKEEIAEELNISISSVINHSMDYKYRFCRYTEVPDSVVQEIRRQVRAGKDKLQVSKEMCISYAKVKRFTRDLLGGSIKRKIQLSKETIEEIRRAVKNGKPKMQVSRELSLSPKLIYHYTKDIIVGHQRDLGIAGNTLEFLQEIMVKGYAKPSMKNSYKNYQKIKRKFPNIRKVKMYGKTMYFIQERSDEAMRDFLENVNKKIISYQELQQIIKLFQGKMGKKDKKKYVGKTN